MADETAAEGGPDRRVNTHRFTVRVTETQDDWWVVAVDYEGRPWAITQGRDLNVGLEAALPYMRLAARPDPFHDLAKRVHHFPGEDA